MWRAGNWFCLPVSAWVPEGAVVSTTGKCERRNVSQKDITEYAVPASYESGDLLIYR